MKANIINGKKKIVLVKLPFIVRKNYNHNAIDAWKKQFVNTGRTSLEGVWRRTQDRQNKKLSGWKNANDCRRKIIHFIDTYDLRPNESKKYDLVLTKAYLWTHFYFPQNEINQLYHKALRGLTAGKWKKISNQQTETYENGDMVAELKRYTQHPEDVKKNRRMPSNCSCLEVTIQSKNQKISNSKKKSPWKILETGIRKKDVRGNPLITNDVKKIQSYLPAQVELGCGPSIEAGVPPLHYLHDVYSIVNPTNGKFILSPGKDQLLDDFFKNPHAFYQKATLMYARALAAKPTRFYEILRKMQDVKLVVGPIITNNFDGLLKRVGLHEKYVRSYKETHLTPHIRFDARAKSLLVVGSHADRRRIQHAAREHGMKVIYVDPEGYRVKGKKHAHLLESAQDEDILIPLTADQFAQKMQKIIYKTYQTHS